MSEAFDDLAKSLQLAIVPPFVLPGEPELNVVYTKEELLLLCSTLSAHIGPSYLLEKILRKFMSNTGTHCSGFKEHLHNYDLSSYQRVVVNGYLEEIIVLKTIEDSYHLMYRTQPGRCLLFVSSPIPEHKAVAQWRLEIGK